MSVYWKDNKMIGALPNKTRQFFLFLIKLSVVIGAGYYIYYRLTFESQIEISDFYQFLKKKGVFSLKNGLFLIILSFFNHFFEIFKWKILVSSFQKISFKRAIKETLTAHLSSLFTPNRIGDYATKGLLYGKGTRTKVLLTNLIGHMSQMTITLILGIAGLSLFHQKFDPNVPYFKIARVVLIIVVIAALTIAGIRQKKYKLRGVQLDKIKRFISEFPKKKLGLTLLLSLIRYLIFSFQFILIVRLFGFNLGYTEGMIALSSMYLIASVIPAIQLFDAVIKGSIALYLFTFLRVPDLIILCATLLSWILNFVIPAFMGAIFIFGLKRSRPKPINKQ